MTETGPARGELERTLARFVARKREADRAARDAEARAMSAAAFRASVAERLRSLEREMSEVRLRVNGLLFLVAGSAVTEVVTRLVR